MTPPHGSGAAPPIPGVALAPIGVPGMPDNIAGAPKAAVPVLNAALAAAVPDRGAGSTDETSVYAMIVLHCRGWFMAIRTRKE